MKFVSFVTKTVAIGFAVVIVLLAIALATLSYSVPPAARHLLQAYDVALDIGALEFRLLKGEVSISDIAARDINSESRLQIAAIDASIDLSEALRYQRLIFSKFRLSGVNIPITQRGEDLLIADIDPARFTPPSQDPPPQAAEDDQQESLDFGWQAIEIDDVNVVYTKQDTDTGEPTASIPVSIDSLVLGPLSSQTPKTPTSIQAKIAAANVALQFGGDAAPLDIGRPGHIYAKVSNINVKHLATLANDLGIDVPVIGREAEGIVMLEGRVSWWLSEARSFINVNDSEFHADGLALNFPDLPTDKPVATNASIQTVQSKTLSADLHISAEKLKVALSPLRISATGLKSQDSRVNYVDASLSPKSTINVSSLYLSIDTLDTGKPEQTSNIELQANVAEFGKLAGEATISPLNPKGNGTLTLNGEQINLSDFSGFSNQAIGKHIDKGALDFSFDANIREGIIDSRAKLQAHQLALTANPDAKAANKKTTGFEAELGMPLNTALNLLRDKDDTIRLNLPVNGPVDSPDININSIINKALFKTLKTAVISQIGPLMALSALDKVKSLSDAAKLKPAVFEPMQSEASAEELATMDKLAKFLVKRKKIKLNVCGVATYNDLPAVRDKPVTADTANDAHREQLVALAAARSSFAKQHLIDKDIDGKRLILCAPGIDDSENAKPRVDFSL